MLKGLARCALFWFALLPGAAAAEPVKLRLAYFSSDRELPYTAVLKPFVDAVNKDAKGILEIQVYPGGALGRPYVEQAQLVLDGTADMAWVNPSLTPLLFPDSAVIQLPGLFRDLHEATMAYTGIMATGRLKGYGKFFVIGSFANHPLIIHARPPVASLADLRGMKVRASGAVEVMTLEALGIKSVVLPINEIALATGRGTIDGTTMPAGVVVSYGISRITTHHYVIPLGAAPLNLLMNREKFESLPTAGQDAIRRHSGGGPAANFVKAFSAHNDLAMAGLKSDPMRKVIFPSQGELDSATAAFSAVIAAWVARSPRNGELLELAEAEIAKFRTVR